VLGTACPLTGLLPHMFHSVYSSGCSKDVLNSLHTCLYYCKLICVVCLWQWAGCLLMKHLLNWDFQTDKENTLINQTGFQNSRHRDNMAAGICQAMLYSVQSGLHDLEFISWHEAQDSGCFFIVQAGCAYLTQFHLHGVCSDNISFLQNIIPDTTVLTLNVSDLVKCLQNIQSPQRV
jgi:hypothetical protein